MVAVLPFDWQAHDSYFVVAHLHYVLIGGALFPVLAALCYWLPLVNGHRLDERAGRWSFGLIFGGFQLAFFPMHIAGLLGMPRRVATYEAGLGWEWPNLLSSIGAAVLGAGMALFTWGIVKALRRPAQPHGDPWHAPTLEWLPSADYGPRSIPQVDGGDPLWRHPRLADEVVQGRHWLPGTATGARETLVTTPRAAVLHHLVVLPGDSALPLVAAIGTAGFFLLLTVKWVVAATAFGVAAVVSTLLWLWETDRPAGAAVEVAEGVRLPVGARLTQSPSWWATVIYLVVDVTVLASIAFSHLHVALLADVCPPAAAALPAPGAVAGSCAAAVLSAGLLWWSGRPLDERALGRWRCVPVLAAFALAAVAFAVRRTGARGSNRRRRHGARRWRRCSPTRDGTWRCRPSWRPTSVRGSGAAWSRRASGPPSTTSCCCGSCCVRRASWSRHGRTSWWGGSRDPPAVSSRRAGRDTAPVAVGGAVRLRLRLGRRSMPRGVRGGMGARPDRAGRCSDRAAGRVAAVARVPIARRGFARRRARARRAAGPGRHRLADRAGVPSTRVPLGLNASDPVVLRAERRQDAGRPPIAPAAPVASNR
jgi:hypothetical protein